MPLRLFMRALDHIEEILIGTLIAAATLLIFVAVIQRYGLSNSINVANWGRGHGYDWLNQGGRAVFAFLNGFNLTWAQELCIYLFIWMAKFGAAYGVRQGIHVGVDVLVNRIGMRFGDPTVGDIVVHDATIDDPAYSFALSRLCDQNLDHTVMGVFRQVSRPTYDDAARAQVAAAAESVPHDGAALQSLLRGRDTWTVN